MGREQWQTYLLPQTLANCSPRATSGPFDAAVWSVVPPLTACLSEPVRVLTEDQGGMLKDVFVESWKDWREPKELIGTVRRLSSAGRMLPCRHPGALPTFFYPAKLFLC